MLNETSPTSSQEISVERRRIPITFGGNGFNALTVEFPPIEELLELRQVSASHVSFRAASQLAKSQFQDKFAEAAFSAMKKEPHFAMSATYFSKTADLLSLGGMQDIATQFNERALKLSPEGVFSLRVSNDLARASRYIEADKLLAEATSVDASEALARRSVIALVAGDTVLAKEFADKSVSANPDDSRSRYLLGVLSLIRSEFESAIRHFRAAAEDLPRSSGLMASLAIAQSCLGEQSKALTSIRKAVSINPIDLNSVAILADLAFEYGKDNISIGPLTEFLRYEQKLPAIWARLARAQFALANYDEAEFALKNQCAIDNSANAWSNRGVVARFRGDKARAARYFSYAIKYVDFANSKDWRIPATNYLASLLESNEINVAINFGQALIDSQTKSAFITNESLAKFYVLYLSTLARLHRHTELAARADEVINTENASPHLVLSALIELIYHYTTRAPAIIQSIEYGRIVLSKFGMPKGKYKELLCKALNNAAYSFVEAGQFESAREALNRLEMWVHKDPYVTATAGFYHIRKGAVEKGLALYSEAISLVSDTLKKSMFTQKLNLEYGKALIGTGEKRLAIRNLRKAANAKGGLETFKLAALKELRALGEGN